MNKIKSERIRLGMTQEQFSEMTGIPRRTIQSWEEGQRKCPDYVERLLLENLHQMSENEDIYLIYNDSMDDAATIVGYIKGTWEEADAYCNDYNAKCKYGYQHVTWDLLDNLQDK